MEGDGGRTSSGVIVLLDGREPTRSWRATTSSTAGASPAGSGSADWTRERSRFARSVALQLGGPRDGTRCGESVRREAGPDARRDAMAACRAGRLGIRATDGPRCTGDAARGHRTVEPAQPALVRGPELHGLRRRDSTSIPGSGCCRPRAGDASRPCMTRSRLVQVAASADAGGPWWHGPRLATRQALVRRTAAYVATRTVDAVRGRLASRSTPDVGRLHRPGADARIRRCLGHTPQVECGRGRSDLPTRIARSISQDVDGRARPRSRRGRRS